MVASAVGEAAGVWGFEEPQAPRVSVVAAMRVEAEKYPSCGVINPTGCMRRVGTCGTMET